MVGQMETAGGESGKGKEVKNEGEYHRECPSCGRRTFIYGDLKGGIGYWCSNCNYTHYKKKWKG